MMQTSSNKLESQNPKELGVYEVANDPIQGFNLYFFGTKMPAMLNILKLENSDRGKMEIGVISLS